jgi:hypothetical protein
MWRYAQRQRAVPGSLDNKRGEEDDIFYLTKDGVFSLFCPKKPAQVKPLKYFQQSQVPVPVICAVNPELLHHYGNI